MGLTQSTRRNADVGSTSDPGVKIISRLEALDDVREVGPRFERMVLKEPVAKSILMQGLK